MAEKTSSQIARPVREQYEKGMAAFGRQNFDYAIAIFNQVLEQDPAFYDCRQALRVSQFKKAGGGGGFFKKMLSGAGSSPLLAKGQLALKNRPIDALKIAEQILNNDPNSGQAHKLLAEGALAADLPKTAILSLEIVVKNAPKDEEALKNLARAYSISGQGEKAEKIFSELMRLHPNDLRLNEELKDISAKKTLAEGGYEALSSGGGSYRDILKNKTQAVEMEQEGRQIKSEDVAQRMIADYEKRLLNEPNNIKVLRSIAELYEGKKDYALALETYQRIVAQEGTGDPALQKAIAETTIRKFDQEIAQVDPQSPDFAEKSAALQAERDKYLLTDAEQRAERYPNDLAIRFELGKLYFLTGNIGKAIPELQKAQNNPNKRIQALTYLGQCFARRKMNDMAARSLQNALKEKLVFDEEKKEIIYALGTVLEPMGKKEEAMDQFKAIYEVDSSFKDVAAKVEGHYSDNEGTPPA